MTVFHSAKHHYYGDEEKGFMHFKCSNCHLLTIFCDTIAFINKKMHLVCIVSFPGASQFVVDKDSFQRIRVHRFSTRLPVSTTHATDHKDQQFVEECLQSVSTAATAICFNVSEEDRMHFTVTSPPICLPALRLPMLCSQFHHIPRHLPPRHKSTPK